MGKNKAPRVDGTILDNIIELGFVDAYGTAVGTDNHRIFAYGGDDLVRTGSGRDTLWGGEGNDTLFGGGDSDRLYGGTGDDDLHGGAGADRLYGDDGDDFLFGGGSGDLMQGGRGNDTLRGGGGDDSLYGNKGNNVLDGGGGDDLISTGDQTSIADGGDGDDTLIARAKKGGDRTLTGGAGADSFEFIQMAKSAQSDMVITDYDLDEDSFSVDGIDGTLFLLATGAANVVASGGDTVVNLLTGDTITFEGIDEAAFEAHFFGLA